MKEQTKLAAFWEAWQSTIIGFVLAWFSTVYFMPVLVHMWGIVWGGTAFTLWMTVLSLARQFIVRVWTEQQRNKSIPPDFLHIAEEIAAERWKQITREGFTLGQDDRLTTRQLAAGAGAYALAASLTETMRVELEKTGPRLSRAYEVIELWPFAKKRFKPTTPRRDLVKAGAMIVAEIGRIDRAEARRG